MKKIIIALLVFYSVNVFSQKDSLTDGTVTLSEDLMLNENKLSIGGYAQIDYNQRIDNETSYNGVLDVHRLVMLFAYNFNAKTSFVTEIEYEHVKEVYIEQAFLNHKINDFFNFRAGLLLIPMGIINEYHEPTTYNGVERPNLDNKLVPTTWREIGLGFTGRFNVYALKYQLYVVNGFAGYNGSATFNGSGLRSGRQKGAESFVSAPNISARVDYYGISGLKLGISGYFGKSQSSLFNGLDKSNSADIAAADSSVVGISMLGADLRYNKNGMQLRAQYYYASLNNSDQYNKFTGSNLASALSGYYLEVGYNVLQRSNSQKTLVAFARYEDFNTQAKTELPLVANPVNHSTTFTTGLTFKLAQGAALKADYQFFKTEADTDWNQQINLGVGILF